MIVLRHRIHDILNMYMFHVNHSQKTHFNFSTLNAEGCVCDAGYYRNNDGICVAKSNCGCYDDSGLIMAAGDGHFEGSSFCKCQSGVIKCQLRKLVDDGYDDQVSKD